MSLRPRLLAFAAATILVPAAIYLGVRREAPLPDAPLPPADALKTMAIADGFRIDLVAAEPMIASPVAMDIDEDGRIFVVEMPGYPLDTSASGRIKVLEDTNGDGRIDRSGVFASGLVLPTGVMRWKRGVIVTAAPDVLYLEDTDGDGRADARTVLLTGFAFTNPQHTVNSPLLGLDNWIYLAHEGPSEPVIFTEPFGDTGRPIRFPAKPGRPLDAGRLGVRFKPEANEVESLAGRSQFGHAFDEWGRYFTLDNSNHVRHEVVASRYLARNPDLLLRSAMQNISDHGPAGTVYPISSRPRLELLSEPGQFTSACGLTFDSAGGFSPPGGRAAFVAEPVHNLVHRDIVSPAGSTFVARRGEHEREFLASTDSWFRPVNFYIGPDGALYVVDYYREMVEHPEWTASEHHQNSESLYRGRDRGRIYRVVPDGHRAAPAPRLSGAGAAELVAALARPNGWWRRAAQRLLVERGDRAAVPLLVDTVRQRPSAAARLHALWTLDALGALDPALIALALEDEEPGVRENAVRLAEARVDVPALREKLLAMGADADPRVRFQLLATLGFLDTPASRALQQRLLLQDLEDEWMQVAALSAGSDRAIDLFERATADAAVLDRDTPARRTLVARMTALVGARGNPGEVERVVATVGLTRARPDWYRASALDGLARGIAARRPPPGAFAAAQAPLIDLLDDASAPVRRGTLRLLEGLGVREGPAAREAFARAERLAARADADAEQRADAIALLAIAGAERLRAHGTMLVSLVEPRQPEVVQVAALRALGRSDDDGVGGALLARWRDMTPEVRSAAADALLNRPARTRALLGALARGDVPRWTLDFWQTRALLMHDDPEIRREARTLLEEKPDERARRAERLDAALRLTGDPARGEQVFTSQCAKCHRLNGAGVEVGPDLGTVRGRPASVLLTDILWPSRSIAPGFEAYVVERASGGIEQGVLASQTPTNVVLRLEEGREAIVPRDDIRRMYASTLSAMPADLDQQIEPQQLADLMAFLKRPPGRGQ